jgi:membrane fusion protein, multidrug efflux system
VIDPRPYEVAMQQAHGQLVQAQAQLKESQIDLSRYATLLQQDSIASQQVDAQHALVSQYEGQVEADQAALNTAKLNLTYCHVVAPVTGRVGLRQVDPGNYVTPGDASGLVVLTQVRPITVIFTLSEDSVPDVAARIHSGATIPVDAYDRTQARKLASGTLDAIDNQVDPTTGTFKLRAVFANADESLFPSQFVNIRMLLNVQKGAIVIPTSAVEHGQMGTFVYVVKPDSTVASRAVTLGASEGERVAVNSGLAVGERVVSDGADKLREGMKVLVQAGAHRAAGGGAPAAQQ